LKVATSARKAEKRRLAPVIREWAGDVIFSNYWVKVGLTRNQLAALSALAKAYGFKKDRVARTARWLIMLGLDCLPILEDRVRALNGYAEAEGFSTVTALLDSRAKQVAAKITADPHWSGKKH
jgi:hypothetical protein